MAVHTEGGSPDIACSMTALTFDCRMRTSEWEVGVVMIESTVCTTHGMTDEARFAVIIIARHAVVL